jgi:hypothetical protein
MEIEGYDNIMNYINTTNLQETTIKLAQVNMVYVEIEDPDDAYNELLTYVENYLAPENINPHPNNNNDILKCIINIIHNRRKYIFITDILNGDHKNRLCMMKI